MPLRLNAPLILINKDIWGGYIVNVEIMYDVLNNNTYVF